MLNPGSIYARSITASAVALTVTLSTSILFAQKSGKGRYINIPLSRDTKKDGYKVYQRGHDEINLTATGVIDPTTGKRLQGKRKFEYQCGGQNYAIDVRFFGGASSPPKKIECDNPVGLCVSFFARPRFLPLIAGAETNGYEVVEDASGFSVRVKGAQDPATKKKLEGSFDFEHRCGFPPKPGAARVLLQAGSSTTPARLNCAASDFSYQSPRTFKFGARIEF